LIHYGDLLLQVGKWGFILCVGLWIVGLIRTWWGSLRMAYLTPLVAIVMGALPSTAILLPNQAFEGGRGEWVMGASYLFGIVVLIVLGMLILTAIAHIIFLLRLRRQKHGSE
jgi:hypothetical protein